MKTTSSEDSLVLESYRDKNDFLHVIVDRVENAITTEASGAKFYNLPQSEIDRIKRMLQGGCGTDVESDNDSPSDNEDQHWSSPAHALQYKDGTICQATKYQGFVSLRKSKIEFLNPKETENGFCVYFLYR